MGPRSFFSSRRSSSDVDVLGYSCEDKGEEEERGGWPTEGRRFFEMTRTDNPGELWEKEIRTLIVCTDCVTGRRCRKIKTSVRGEFELP